MDALYQCLSCVPTPPLQTAHKQSARAYGKRHRAKPLSLHIDYQNYRQSIDPPVTTFRSPRVLKEIVEVEKKHQHRFSMTPEEAFEKLQRVRVNLPSERDAREVFNGLKSACWQPFASISGESNQNHPSQILYSQLYFGTQETFRGEVAACQELRDQVRHLEERNNELPNRIQETQTALTRAIKFSGCDSVSSGSKLVSTDNVDVNASSNYQERKETRHRKELRTWVCSNLRATVNDLDARQIELKLQVNDTSCELKKEVQANNLQLKRLEDLRTLATTSSQGRGDLKNTLQQQLARFTLALAKHQMLLETLKERKAFVRARTEAIFDVRNCLHDLNNQRLSVEKNLKELEDQAEHMKRACTPRPEWSALHDATSVTTAVDHVDPLARMRLGAIQEEDRDCDTRVMQILTSKWSTVAKIDALATELETIRSRDHVIDTISSEETKLKILQHEIAHLLQQLQAVKGQTAIGTRDNGTKS